MGQISPGVSYQEEWIEELAGEVEVAHPGRAQFHLPLIVSQAEIVRLLGCAAGPTRLALRLIYAGGLRPHEPWQLGSLHGHVVSVNNRQVVLDEETARQLPSLELPSGPEELTAGLHKAAAASGLLARFEGGGRRLTLNALRHACAAHCLANGMDLNCLYHQLGHEWFDLTRIYVRTAVTNLGLAYAAAHPLMQGGARPHASWNDGEIFLEDVEEDEEEDRYRGAPFARLTYTEVLEMLAAARKPRERLMVRTFYASGVRLSELLSLLYLDLRPEECSLFVRGGKMSKDRYCLVDPETMQQLLDRRGDSPADTRIFSLSKQAVNRYLRDIARRTGLLEKYAALGQKVCPHSLRNTFATHCYLGGMSLGALRTLLGHSDLQTTLAYLECSAEHRQHVYEASRGC